MIELLQSVNYWHWLAFGLVLLASELLGTAGYLLWLGLSAIVVGVLMTFLPLSWQLQWVAFGVFSLATTWLWWRRQYQSDTESDSNRQLNQKHKQLIGTVIVLEEDLQPGRNRIKLGDTTWAAETPIEMKKGERVVVESVEGILLHLTRHIETGS
ncbi:NfeD family protein [Vibrio sinaloensis]|uniref:NfeD family protein n=1 Tax=Photobacterium sp. (strain ATCC 43367) TaxID=379097 RepID=UPI002061B89D|nr:NfeD family protein [Vibrio sinaloensis]UPQ88629.1 NfeD family protein [Vibrio sinaloensis]